MRLLAAPPRDKCFFWRPREAPGAARGRFWSAPGVSLGPPWRPEAPWGGPGPHFGLSGVPPGSILGTIFSDFLCDFFEMILLHRACVSVLVLVFKPVFCFLACDLGTAELPSSIYWVTFIFTCVLVVAYYFLKASKPQRPKLEALHP